MTDESKLAPIRKGLLEFLVLKIVGAESMYVPDILRRLAGTEFTTQEGTLYPLLSKLRREDLVHYEWKESDAGPPRKYYRLTDSGRAQLDCAGRVLEPDQPHDRGQSDTEPCNAYPLPPDSTAASSSSRRRRYARLEAVPRRVGGPLEGNPDQQEILGDLEQAVADQCTRRTATRARPS